MKYRLKQQYRVNKVDDDGFTTNKYINMKQYSIWEILQDHWAKNDYEIILQQTEGSKQNRYWVGLSIEKFKELFEELKESDNDDKN